MMNKILYLSIIIMSFLSCEIDTKTKNKSIEKSKSNRIDSLANRYLELNRFSGTIAVKRGDSVIYHQSFGLADYENKIPFSDKTAFKIGQITELITWSILNKLVKKEKNELSDSVSQYFSELKSDLTVEDLLNQSFYSSNTKDEIDFNTLGRLIEKVSGKSYQENIKEYGDDLELENTYFQKEDSSAAIGYLFHNYRGNGLELQKSPSFNPEIAFSSKGIKSTANDLIKIVSTDVTKELELDGYLETDGFSYSLVKKSNDKIIIIVLSNRRHPVAKEISNSIEAILKNEEYKVPLSRKPFSINSKLLEDYSGKYALNENVSFEVVNTGDSLFVLLGPNKVALIPQSKNQFYMKDNDASMRFDRDSTGTISSVFLLNGFIDSQEKATRIEE